MHDLGSVFSKLIGFLVLSVILASFLLTWNQGNEPAKQDGGEQAITEQSGNPQVAHEITGEDLDGQPMRLSQFRGQVVMLDFWGNW